MNDTTDDEITPASAAGTGDGQDGGDSAATTGARPAAPAAGATATAATVAEGSTGSGNDPAKSAADVAGEVGAGATAAMPLLPDLGIRALAEFLGTFLLVFGLLALTSWYEIVLQSVVLLPLGVFVIYAGVTAMFARISGAHLNPAVSLAAVLLSRISWLDFVSYVVAQTLGGLVAALAVTATVPTSASTGVSQWFLSTVNGYGELSPGNSLLQNVSLSFGAAPALIVEIVASLIAVGAVVATMGAVSESPSGAVRGSDASRALIVGAGYAAGFFIAWPVTGGSINPARSTGIAIVAKLRGISDAAVTNLPVFWIAPFIAAAVVALFVILATIARQPRPSRRTEQHATLTSAVPGAPLDQDAANEAPQDANGADRDGADGGHAPDAADRKDDGEHDESRRNVRPE